MSAEALARPVNHLRLVGTANSNKVMAAELLRLAWAGLRSRPNPPRKEGTGGLVFEFDRDLARLAVLYHRTSARVLWDVFDCSARRLEPLYAALHKALVADARPLFWPGARISVEAYGVDAFAAGERQIVGTVKNALVDALGERGIPLSVDASDPDVLVSVRMPDGKLVVSLDLAGRPMHRRGYRANPGEAPLREDLAAQLVMQTRHDPRREILLDPMAGSGTLVIEAAGLARARPIWAAERRPSVASYPSFREAFEAPELPLFDAASPVLLANEADAKTHGLMSANVKAADEGSYIRTRHGDFREIDPESLLQMARDHGKDPGSGVVVVNPPFGHRLTPDTDRLLFDLAEWCRRLRGWRVGIITPGPEAELAFGTPRLKKPVKSGPLKACFMIFQM